MRALRKPLPDSRDLAAVLLTGGTRRGPMRHTDTDTDTDADADARRAYGMVHPALSPDPGFVVKNLMTDSRLPFFPIFLFLPIHDRTRFTLAESDAAELRSAGQVSCSS